MTEEYYKEIRLSREFANQFSLYLQQSRQTVSASLIKSYEDLIQHYNDEIERGVQ